jgi:hypothetical protein
MAISLYQVRFVNSFHNSCYNIGSRSEVLRLGVGPNHLLAVDAISKHLREKCPEVFGVAAAGDDSSEPGSALRNAVKFFSSPIESDAKSDQHYIDDLRAGAFQYVEAENDDHTKPYQVALSFFRNASSYISVSVSDLISDFEMLFPV